MDNKKSFWYHTDKVHLKGDHLNLVNPNTNATVKVKILRVLPPIKSKPYYSYFVEGDCTDTEKMILSMDFAVKNNGKKQSETIH